VALQESLMKPGNRIEIDTKDRNRYAGKRSLICRTFFQGGLECAVIAQNYIANCTGNSPTESLDLML